MKKIIFVILILGTITAASCAGSRNSDTGNIISTIDEYRYEPGFEVITIGKLGLGLAKVAANLSAESKDDREALRILNDINKVVIVNYEDSSDLKREEFGSRLSEVFEKTEKIMEIKDEEDIINIYGTSVNGGESIDDLILFRPEDRTLIYILCSISAKRIEDLIKMANE